MPFQRQISNGILFLLSNRNNDEGIPATNLGDGSGCWTTAEAIDILLRSPYLPKKRIADVRKMVEFLLQNQIPGRGWAMALEREYVSSMATGHALIALHIAEDIFHEDEELVQKCKKAKAEALDWIRKYNNPNEGWGVEPEKEGKETRIISTYYVLKGLIALGFSYSNSNDVKRAIDYLVSIVNKDNGWGGRKGAQSDPANTARVISILLQSGKFSQDDPIIRKGLKYILDSQNDWTIDIESYTAKGAPGQVFFHSNTPADVLEAFIRCEYYGNETHNLIDFLLTSQEDTDGRWYLCDKFQKDTSICTWSTSEAIGVLDLAQEEYFESLFYRHDSKSSARMRLILSAVSIISILEFLYIIHFHDTLSAWWHSLSEGWQLTFLGIIISIIVGLLVSFLNDKIKSIGKKLRKRQSVKTYILTPKKAIFTQNGDFKK